MDNKFMKERAVLPLLMSMALPMVISMAVNALYNIVDSYFVAKISEDAMAALSLVYPVQNFVNAAAIGFGVGINAVISFHLGAGNNKNANTAATHGLLFAVIHGIVLTFGCILIMPHFVKMFTTDKDVIELSLKYSYIVFLFSVIVMLSLSFEKIFQSVGKMKVTMISLLCGCVTNIILDPVLIFGIGIFPEMGIKGAALATGIGQAVTLAIYLAVYFCRPIQVKVSSKYLALDKKLDLRLYAIGVPAILNLALPSMLVSFLNRLLSLYSQSYVVVLGIYYKLQTFLYLPANGIIQGMRPLIGYNYGAGESKRVKKIYNTTLFMNCIIMFTGTIICFCASAQLIGMFTDNAETILLGKNAFQIISVGFIASAVSVTSSGALEGLGKGIQSFVISLFRYIVIIIPASFIITRLTGPANVWNAFWIAEMVTAVLSVFIYRMSVRTK